MHACIAVLGGLGADARPGGCGCGGAWQKGTGTQGRTQGALCMRHDQAVAPCLASLGRGSASASRYAVTVTGASGNWQLARQRSRAVFASFAPTVHLPPPPPALLALPEARSPPGDLASSPSAKRRPPPRGPSAEVSCLGPGQTRSEGHATHATQLHTHPRCTRLSSPPCMLTVVPSACAHAIHVPARVST